MNSISKQLLMRLKNGTVPFEKTYGFVTKEHRWLMELPKAHWTDAVAIACQDNLVHTGQLTVVYRTNTMLKKTCVSVGDYRRRKGAHSQNEIPPGKIHGFKRYDKVLYRGQVYFVAGRRSKGTCELTDINGVNIKFKETTKYGKIPKLCDLQRVTARSSWMVDEQPLNASV